MALSGVTFISNFVKNSHLDQAFKRNDSEDTRNVFCRMQRKQLKRRTWEGIHYGKRGAHPTSPHHVGQQRQVTSYLHCYLLEGFLVIHKAILDNAIGLCRVAVFHILFARLEWRRRFVFIRFVRVIGILHKKQTHKEHYFCTSGGLLTP